MPTTRQRARDLAIARKGAYETDLLFADDDMDVAPQPLKLKEANVKTEAMTSPGSPVSVASTFDILPDEIKPIVLPGAWVVVGKGGKPLKSGKMYDEPIVRTLPATSKKKKKKKMRKAEELSEPEPLLVLEEAASSSTSLKEFLRSTTQRNKSLARAKDAKYWAKYQHAKQLRREALNNVVAAMMLNDSATEEEVAARVPTPSTKAHKDHKANSSKYKARRRARSAAAAARCCVWLDDEPSSVPISMTCDVEMPPSPWLKVQTSGELQLCFGSMPEPKPPGAWTTVGKRGKAMTNFPPLTPSGSAEPPKRRESPAAAASDKSLPQTSADKRGKGMKCSVM